MRGRRHTPEQVVRKLREADKLLGEGFELLDVLKELEISPTRTSVRVTSPTIMPGEPKSGEAIDD